MRKRSPLNRSQMMRAVKSEDTKPERTVRKALFKRGIRFRLHLRTLPGTPDLYILKYHVVVFVNGCFWHQHGCRFSKRPKSHTEFWNEKFDNNAARDVKILQKLSSMGFRVAVIWECALRNPGSVEKTVERLVAFIRGREDFVEI